MAAAGRQSPAPKLLLRAQREIKKPSWQRSASRFWVDQLSPSGMAAAGRQSSAPKLLLRAQREIKKPSWQRSASRFWLNSFTGSYSLPKEHQVSLDP
jgi:hypothetical protein